jgi:glycosyltransferase involved in cell wall biosynthesis
VKAAANDEVVFLGSIYDATVLSAIRKHSIAYLHGHRVGGTNPSLLEAMGAGNAVIAHDNQFNRWVAGEGAVYFDCEDSADNAISSLIADAARRTRLAAHSLARARSEFAWDSVLSRYHSLLIGWSREAAPVEAAPARLPEDGTVVRARDLRP